MKVINFILKLLGGLIALSVVAIVGASYWESIVFQYNKLFWEPDATTAKGISIGDRRSDVIFKRGNPNNCVGDNDDICIWPVLDRFGNPSVDPPPQADFMARFLSEGRQVVVRDRFGGIQIMPNGQPIMVDFEPGNDVVDRLTDYNPSLPFEAVEEMKAILGEEDILATTSDFTVRHYTYLEWGVTYSFQSNRVSMSTIGRVLWRSVFVSNGVSEYIVQGRVVCPSDDCPWDDVGNLKPEYEDKSYRDFLPQ